MYCPYECPWKDGGIENFIEVNKTEEEIIDCVELSFDAESFVKPKNHFFNDVYINHLAKLKQEKGILEMEIQSLQILIREI